MCEKSCYVRRGKRTPSLQTLLAEHTLFEKPNTLGEHLQSREDPQQEFEIVYLGPALNEGRIDVIVLADALRGFGTLTERTSDRLFRDGDKFHVELASNPRTGSIIIPVGFVSHAVDTAENVLSSKGAVALTVLVTLLGLSPVKDAINFLKLFKRLSGRAATDVEPIKDLLIDPKINVEIRIVLETYSDPEVRASIRRILRPLREPGIEAFETRRNGNTVERVDKSDLFAADEAELEEIVGQEEKTLDIQKAALVRHLAWHFSDAGYPFDAQIEDEKLWARVMEGERFGSGDRMRVVLKTTAKRDSTGRLRVERTIPEVLEVEHATKPQRDFFDEDPRT